MTTSSPCTSSDPTTTRFDACVYYIHGGAMAGLSCTYGSYRTWGRLIAAHGVVVVMVEFRNAVSPSTVRDVAPFPAGLNDCVSGLRYVHRTPRHLASTPHESSCRVRAAAAI